MSKTEKYSLVIFQSPKDRGHFFLHLRKDGKQIKDRKVIGTRRNVGQIVFLLLHYARTKGIDFKEAWDMDEIWQK